MNLTCGLRRVTNKPEHMLQADRWCEETRKHVLIWGVMVATKGCVILSIVSPRITPIILPIILLIIWPMISPMKSAQHIWNNALCKYITCPQHYLQRSPKYHPTCYPAPHTCVWPNRVEHRKLSPLACINATVTSNLPPRTVFSVCSPAATVSMGHGTKGVDRHRWLPVVSPNIWGTGARPRNVGLRQLKKTKASKVSSMLQVAIRNPGECSHRQQNCVHAKTQKMDGRGHFWKQTTSVSRCKTTRKPIEQSAALSSVQHAGHIHAHISITWRNMSDVVFPFMPSCEEVSTTTGCSDANDTQQCAFKQAAEHVPAVYKTSMTLWNGTETMKPLVNVAGALRVIRIRSVADTKTCRVRSSLDLAPLDMVRRLTGHEKCKFSNLTGTNTPSPCLNFVRVSDVESQWTCCAQLFWVTLVDATLSTEQHDDNDNTTSDWTPHDRGEPTRECANIFHVAKGKPQQLCGTLQRHRFFVIVRFPPARWCNPTPAPLTFPSSAAEDATTTLGARATESCLVARSHCVTFEKLVQSQKHTRRKHTRMNERSRKRRHLSSRTLKVRQSNTQHSTNK